MYWFLIRAVSLLFRVFSAMILIYCILSWFAQPGSAVYTIYRRLEELVEPFIFPSMPRTTAALNSHALFCLPHRCDWAKCPFGCAAMKLSYSASVFSLINSIIV